MTRHHNRRGFSLIEAAIVLAVVGLVIGGMWVGASTVYTRWKEIHFYEQVSHIVRTSQERFSQSQPCDTGYLNVITIKDLGIYPLDAPTGVGMAYWGRPSIWIACDGTYGNYNNGASYLRLVWWPYGNFKKFSRADCSRIKNFLLKSFGHELLESQDCDSASWTNVAFGFALPRLRN